MMKSILMVTTAIGAMSLSSVAHAQTEQDDQSDQNVIIVTAQRQAESLQEVPIAVSAFNAEALEAQQIKNSSDLQLTLPNITFTKTNFTGASFTIRGIGDLCVGVSCDQATAIHLNESPLFSTRLFESEFYDLERVEVLRGPQGTLFGRNATSGVVNVVTAKPVLGDFQASADAEYGNFNSIKVKGMVNVPVGDTLALRVAGLYLNRDGYTKNLYDGSRIDDRDLYSVRGSLRWEPGTDTTVDLFATYFREKDHRMRAQKQLCQRDPTGVLGCLNNRRDAEAPNYNNWLGQVLNSQELYAVLGLPTELALGSVYDTNDYLANAVVSPDPRVVNTAYTPEYFTSELILQGKLEHDFGPVAVQLGATYQKIKLDPTQDYLSNNGDRSYYDNALNTLAAYAANPATAAYFGPVASALIPNGPSGELCTSGFDTTGFGVFGGTAVCSERPLTIDASTSFNSSWSAEAIISSDLDGPFNFLIGGIYSKYKITEASYYVSNFDLDYFSGVVGALTALGGGLDPSFNASPYYRNNDADPLTVKSYGIFGEVYYDVSDNLKITAGLRYNNDKKFVRARQTLLNFLVPFGQTGDMFDSPYLSGYDGDPVTPGEQLWAERSAKFDKVTGRVVVDWQFTPDNLLYASYSRGYKSGGINPPVQAPGVLDAFRPEQVDAIEIGSKNSFGRELQLNLTAFYYKYKDLQLSRIVSRSSVNDNIDADIYGVEAEAVIRPTRDWMVNLGFSWLKTKVTGDTYMSNPRDFGGGRSDAVIIKDLTNAANCAVAPVVAGNASGINDFVTQVNAGLGLQGPTPFPADGGIASTGAFSICGALADSIENPSAGLIALYGTQADGTLPFAYYNSGIPLNIKGNRLPLAPNIKASLGVQYTADIGSSGMTLVPRADIALVGESFGNVFNGKVNRIEPYTQVNAQIQLNSADESWYVRAFVQNLFDSEAVTGLYVTDQSSALFTNIFTLEPRRFGIGAGVTF